MLCPCEAATHLSLALIKCDICLPFRSSSSSTEYFTHPPMLFFFLFFFLAQVLTNCSRALLCNAVQQNTLTTHRKSGQGSKQIVAQLFSSSGHHLKRQTVPPPAPCPDLPPHPPFNVNALLHKPRCHRLGFYSSTVAAVCVRGRTAVKQSPSRCLPFIGARCFLMLDHAQMGNNRPHGR